MDHGLETGAQPGALAHCGGVRELYCFYDRLSYSPDMVPCPQNTDGRKLT